MLAHVQIMVTLNFELGLLGTSYVTFVNKNKIAENDLQLLKVLTLRKKVVQRATFKFL